jgi:hypothetical protein
VIFVRRKNECWSDRLVDHVVRFSVPYVMVRAWHSYSQVNNSILYSSVALIFTEKENNSILYSSVALIFTLQENN